MDIHIHVNLYFPPHLAFVPSALNALRFPFGFDIEDTESSSRETVAALALTNIVKLVGSTIW